MNKYSLPNITMPDVSMRGRLAFGGGGGGGTVESIPDWYKPYIERGAQNAQAALESGALSNVANLNQTQVQGLDATVDAANKAADQYDVGVGAQNKLSQIASGQEIVPASTGATTALKNNAVSQAQAAWAPTQASLASQGQVGGARGALLAQQRDANLANQLAGIDYQDLNARRQAAQSAAGSVLGASQQLSGQAGQAGQYLGAAGSTLQSQKQREQDAAFQGLSRYAGLLSGQPTPTQQQKAGGK